MTSMTQIADQRCESALVLVRNAETGPELIAALDALTDLYRAAQICMQTVALQAPHLTTQLLRDTDIDETQLHGRPYGPTRVRELARAAGRPARPRGRRPARS